MRPALISLRPVARYGFAIAVIAVAAALRFALSPVWGAGLPYITFYPAVMISAWLGGLGPGLVATALSALIADYFWVAPAFSLATGNLPDALGLFVFIAMGVVIGFMNEAWRRSAGAAFESQQRLAVTLTSIGDGVITTDASGRITRINPVAQALVGWGEGEAIGQPLTDVFVIVNEQTRQPVFNVVDRVLETGAIARFANHTVLVAREGREIPIDDSAAPIRTQNGEITGVVVVFRDITDRRRAEAGHARVLEAERTARQDIEVAVRQLEAALRAGRMGTWEYGLRTGTVKWSPGLEAIHGYAPGTFPGTFEAFRNEIHPDDRGLVLQAIADAAEQRRDHHIEYRIVRADGVVRWVEGRGQLFLDASQQPERMVGVCTDITERKQAEERFRMAVEAAPAAMLMVDQRGTIVLANTLTEQLLGYARDEIVGQPLDTLVPPRLRERHPEYRKEFFSEPRQRPMGAGRDLYALRKDGSEVPVEIGLSPMQTDEGTFVLAAVTDITARKSAETLLRARTEELERVLEVIPTAVLIANAPDYRHAIANKAALKMSGVPDERQWAPGDPPIPVRVYRDGRELPEDARPTQRAAATGQPQVNEELEVEYPDGTRITIFGDTVPLLDADGKVRGVVSAYSDITERKRAEQALRASESDTRRQLAEINSLYDAAPSGLCVFDREFRFVRVNAALGAINGVLPADHIGKTPYEIVPEIAAAAETQFRRVISTGAPVRFEMRGTTRATGGGERVWDEQWYPLLGPDGSVTAVGVIVEDITERKQLEHERAEVLQREQTALEELNRASRLKDEFLAVLSHELRTPLNAVLGYAHLLRTGTLEPDRAKHAIEAIQRNAQAQTRLVESLIDLSRIMAGKLELDLERLEAPKLIECRG